MPKIIMDTERAPFSFEYLEGKTGLDIDTLMRLDSPGYKRQRLTDILPGDYLSRETDESLETPGSCFQEATHKTQHDIKIEHMVTGSKQVV